MKFEAKVIALKKLSKYLPTEYKVKCFVDGQFATEYTRHGRSDAFALKREFESTGILPRM